MADGMYTWIWRKLPGGLPGKIIGSLILLVLVAALLFFYVFPWVEPRLPVGDVTVDGLVGDKRADDMLGSRKVGPP